MDSLLPVKLTGPTLKERHHNFNVLVTEACKKNVSFDDIAAVPEITPIDRLLKIDIASSYRNVEYILASLKDNDMLFVSRSLKCLWLLDTQYSNIINPHYLENTLYPQMIQPAVNKIKHWIQLHLKDPERCQEFYNYYKTNFNVAFNYFWHCSNEFILSELPNVIHKVSPKQLKIISEICPLACKLYFEIVPNNQEALANYVKNPPKFFSSVKSILKYDGNLFLDILERYFDSSSFDPFGATVTEYVMKYHRNRFDAKSELYIYSFLHMNTVAANMRSNQAEEIVLRLAQAKYLSHWFNYKKVEPLIKRLKPEDRAALKKLVFVDRSADYKVEDWPYALPKPLVIKDEVHVFTDAEHQPYEYEYRNLSGLKCCKALKKRKGRADCDIISTGKSPLDQLFNRYRFKGFEQTFYELSKNLLAESQIEGRLNLMLVLVSKSGGVAAQVEKFLRLLVQRHKNEPSTLRAAVVRSLVKRACAWRLPDNVWSLLLEFGKDIGLDGAETDPLCREGLHAVVIHHLLADTTLPPTLLKGFLREFSTLSEYKFNADEKTLIAKRLPPLILPLNPNAFLDTLIQYEVNIKDIVDAQLVLLNAAKDDTALVARLYEAKMFRRELIRTTFALRSNNASYINALRHDTTILESGKSFSALVAKERPNHNRFLNSLSLYFSEPGGLAEQHRRSLEEAIHTNSKAWIARALCFLLSDVQLLSHLSKLESERPQSKEQVLMSVGLRANAHNARPPLDIEALDCRWIGAKAVANRASICRANDQERYIKRMMQWARTAKISVRLSVSCDTFIALCSLRPFAALKVAFSLYLTRDYIEPRIWNAIKEILQNKDMFQKRSLLKKLSDPSRIPDNIVADYWMQVFNVLMKIDRKKAMRILCRLENILYDVDRNFVTSFIKEFLNTKLSRMDISPADYEEFEVVNTDCLYVRIIAKHLLLCKSEAEQEELIKNICEPFFDIIDSLQKLKPKKHMFNLLDEFIISLKYSKVFLSTQYVSCLPVYEGILKLLRKTFPVEEYFSKYAEIHLTMLYYKTLKQAIKLKPDIFDDPKKWCQATDIVGRIFGNYIGYEISQLVAKYFKSIVDLYKVDLEKYLRKYFNFSDSRDTLVTFIIKGILEANTIEAYIIAEYVFLQQRYALPEPHRGDILKVLKESKDEEVRMFLYADVI